MSLFAVLYRHVNKMALKAIKVAPTAMVIGGSIGVVAGTVMACKATVKAKEELAPEKKELDQIHEYKEAWDAGDVDRKTYSEDEYRSDIVTVYTKAAIKAGKIYAPAVGTIALSLGSIIFSHKLMLKRNLGLATAYAALNNGFKAYRKNVIADQGKDADAKYRFGIVDDVIDITTENEDGTTTTETKQAKVIKDPNMDNYSIYAKFYDEGCNNWTKDPELNLMQLRAWQDIATNRLISNGFLFLNDVYDMIGIERTRAGQIVGWIYDPTDPCRDNYVDFGIYNIDRVPNRRFVNGEERNILLDFNVDGDILNEI